MMELDCSLVIGVMLSLGVHESPVAPIAKKIPHRFEEHGNVRVDDYYWLRERDNPDVIAYLEAENAYLDTMMAPVADLREQLYEEIVGRIDPTDESVPYLYNGYYYYDRFVPDGDYALECRKKGSLTAPEEIMLDGNELARGHEFFSLRARQVSSDNEVVAFAVDTVGRRKYTIRFKNLATGNYYPDAIGEVTGNMAWAEGSRVLFYARQDPMTLRSYQIWRHGLGDDPANDTLVYQEDDETFSCYVRKSKSRRYLLIHCSQTLSDEVRFLAADDPLGEWRVFQPRERNLEYSVAHAGDHFLVRTNWDAENFRLMKTAANATEKANWRDLVAHRADVLLEDFDVFADYLVLGERQDGLPHIRVIARTDGTDRDIEFVDPTYSAWIGDNPEYDTPVLRYVYTSPTTPNSVYDYDMSTREQKLRKRTRVLGDFDPANYRSEYRYAQAEDGTRIPISLVYRVDRFARGTNPLLLYGYGSYGASSWATFNSSALSLLDRGFVYAIAHVRGGEEMGRRWYEDGKLMNKLNTFTDFIACGRYLAAAGYGDPTRLYAIGGSAGGLLIGAVINMAPDLFDGAVAWVPFVDVVTTMLDDSIPLTTAEYDEWGDPNEADYYRYMLGYSPYDQVSAQAYPNLLVTAGLHDSQVQYFEPAKWVAKLRALKTDDNLLLLYTNMEAGHGGASGRFKRHRETALAYAFLLQCAGVVR